MTATSSSTGLPRIISLDMMRGVAVILMVFTHVMLWGITGDWNVFYSKLSGTLTPLRMPVLFLISGIIAANLHKKPGRPIVGRVLDLLWLYAIWLPISGIFSASFSIEKGHSDFDVRRLPVEFIDPTTVLWFLWALIIYTISIPLAVRFPRKLLMLIAMLVSLLAYNIEMPSFGIWHLLKDSVFFYAGLAYRTEITTLMRSPPSLRRLVIIISSVVLLSLLIKIIKQNGFLDLQSIQSALFCACALYAIRFVERYYWISDGLAKLGSNTFPILVGHIPALVLLREYMPNLGPVQSFLMPLILVALTITVSILFNRVVTAFGGAWMYKRPQWTKGIRLHFGPSTYFSAKWAKRKS